LSWLKRRNEEERLEALKKRNKEEGGDEDGQEEYRET